MEDLSVRFEVGKKYKPDNISWCFVEVVSRTKHFVTVKGHFNGRFKIHVVHHEIGDEEMAFLHHAENRDFTLPCSAFDAVM